MLYGYDPENRKWRAQIEALAERLALTDPDAH